MENIQDNSHWVKAYNDAKSQIQYHHEEGNKLKNALPFLKEKAFGINYTSSYNSPIPNDSPIVTREEVQKYKNLENFIKISNGRVGLFAKKVKTLGSLHYKKFLEVVNKNGDQIKEKSFYVTLNRVAEDYDLINDGGVFKPKV